MKRKVIQMIFLQDSKTYIFLKDVIFETPEKGEIIFNGNPVELEREEHFIIKDGNVVTNQYFFSVQFMYNFLHMNNMINENGEIIN